MRRLTMRLSDAGLRQRQTKALYPDHQPPTLAHRRRDPRSLQPIVRSMLQTQQIALKAKTSAFGVAFHLQLGEFQSQIVRIDGHTIRIVSVPR